MIKQTEIPTALPTNQVRLRIRVRYGECDAQGVVFNARYADYADIAATEYIRALVGNYKTLIDAGFDNQVVNLTIDWFASARFDEVLELSVAIDHVGNSSFRLKTECKKVLDDGSFALLAVMRTTYVVVDNQHFTKQAIPEAMREQFARRFNILVDQSGVAA